MNDDDHTEVRPVRDFYDYLVFGLAVLYFAIAASTGPSSVDPPPALSPKFPIELPGVKGRMDHFSVDVSGQRLFVSAVANHSLEILDLRTNQRVHSIPDLAEPQGVYYDASTNRIFVACALDGAVKIFDGFSFKLLTTVKFPEDADNLRYDARSKTIIVGYAGAKALRNRNDGTGGLGFLDANGKILSEVVVDAHPESFRLETTGTRLFVNVPDMQEIEVVDVRQRKVIDRWPVTSAGENFPMALDESHGRLFVATRTPPRLLVFNTASGKEITFQEIAGSSDDLFYDASHARIYVLTRESAIDLLQQKDPDHYERVARVPTPPRTQTGLFVSEWGRLFAAAPQQGDQAAQVLVFEAN